MAALLDEQRAGRRSVVDLLRGAADAWLVGPRGPLGGLEIWVAVAAYGVASVAVTIGRRTVGLVGGDWDTIFHALYLSFFIVFVNWLAHQPAAECDLTRVVSRLRRSK